MDEENRAEGRSGGVDISGGRTDVRGSVAGRDVNLYPAPVSVVHALHGLPPPPGDFTGRQEELDELMKAAGSHGATISGLRGMGGVGKTALALKLADKLTPLYPDAQFYVNLLGTSKEPPLEPRKAMEHVIH